MKTDQLHKPAVHNISGWRFRLLELRFLRQLVRVAFRIYPTRGAAWQAIRRQVSAHLAYRRICQLTKAVRIGERIFTHTSFPHLNGAAGQVLASNELQYNLPIPGRRPGLNKLLLAITKKCSLQCAHCLAWDELNGRETLAAADVLDIIRKFQAGGLATVELSGGEPLNRYQDLLRIVQESNTGQTDFWLITSGYRLTAPRAQALRDAGLVGVAISLDHWDAAAHDQFRGLEGSFEWARQAAQHATEAGLAVCLALTPVRAFCTPENLWHYARLARDWGVHFIRILEPQPVGHFAGQDISLRPADIAVLENFVRKIHREPAYRDYPIIDYYAPHQRQSGCSGAGMRFLYVDTDGDMHACPFCQHKCGSAVHESVETGIENMALASGCHRYSPFRTVE
ncbi:MAG: radical SAM protein [Bacteroidetes bacterium]|nr:MAG: radical SAM protein [Bacteroidota bacterium]